MNFIKSLLPMLLPFPILGGIVARMDRMARLQYEWDRMSNGQKKVAQAVAQYGLRYNLSETMRAICWQESSFGIHLSNKKDGSYGYFGNRSQIVAIRHFNIWPEYPSFEQEEAIIAKLVVNWEFARIVSKR